jgi:hypothetical protein
MYLGCCVLDYACAGYGASDYEAQEERAANNCW